MAIIYTYPVKSTPVGDDKLLMSDSNGGETKQATITSIKDTIDVVDSLAAGAGISLSGPSLPTGDITIANTGVLSVTSAFGTYISGTNNSSSTGNVSIGTVDLNAVNGTAVSATRFLSKDNTWDVPPAYSGAANVGYVPSGGSGTTFLRGDGSWESISLTSDVAGTLPVGNGGTGLTSITTLENSNVNYSSDGSGTLPILNGGTGQTTANAALNALLPDQSAANGKYLKSNGTDVSWDAPSGSGTVTGTGTVASYTLFRGTTSIGDAPMVVDNATSPTVSTHTGNFINTGTFSNTGNFTIKGITTNIIPNGPGISSPTLLLGADTTNDAVGPKITLNVAGIPLFPLTTKGSYTITPPTAMTSGDEGNRTWTLPAGLATNGQVLSVKGVTTVGVDSDYELDWIDYSNIYTADGALTASRQVDLGATGTKTLWFSGAGDGVGTTVRFSPKVRIDNNLDIRTGQLHEHQNDVTSAEGGAITLDFDTGNTQVITNQAGTTANLNIGIPSNLKKGATYKIIITYDVAPSAIQFNSCFQFPGAGSPGFTSSTSKYDVYTCYCLNADSGSEKLLCEQALGYE